jgi:hypothetical protein
MNQVTKKITAHPLRIISYSSLQTLHSCPRKFELDRVGSQTLATIPEREESVHTGYGSAFGAGLQALLSGSSLARAKIEAIANYRFSEIYPIPFYDEKSLFHCLNSLTRFAETELSELESDWQPLLINGKPASEVSFVISYPNSFYDRGFIDFILQHRVTKKILVVEIKTDGGYAPLNKESVEAKYGNSQQGTSYALVADYLASKLNLRNEISVVYIVHRTKTNSFESYLFPKPASYRLRFIKDKLAELGMLDFLITRALDKESPEPFPSYGNCATFNRVCNYYKMCHMKQDYSKVKEIYIGDFEFHIPILELLDLQTVRLNEKE